MIGDYEKVGWTPTNLQPVNGFNLQKLDEKIDEVDKHLLNVKALKGDDGKTAYQVAVDNGFSGSIIDWLNSLRGEQGEQGIKGDKGENGFLLSDDNTFTGATTFNGRTTLNNIPQNVIGSIWIS